MLEKAKLPAVHFAVEKKDSSFPVRSNVWLLSQLRDDREPIPGWTFALKNGIDISRAAAKVTSVDGRKVWLK
jgi:hypothetical protein